jgi:hypothetical protein
MSDLGGYEDIKRRHTGNGHDPDGVLRLISFEEMRPRVGDGYLIKHLLGSTAMAVVYGESGTGKTFLALHISLSVSAGADVFGHRVRRVGVVYIAAEAGRGIENRVAAAKHEIEYPETMPFAAITTPIDLCTDKADLEKLISTIRAADIGMPVELIVIDTLSRTMGGGNENQPDDMGAFVTNVDRLRAETGAAVLIVHHSGKDASRGARGHSLLRAATDTEIEVTRDEATKIATARVTKQREFPTDGIMAFTLCSVELGIDQDGDPITSCIVVEEAAGEQAPRTTAKRLSPAQGRALELLAKAIDEAGEIAPASNHIPPNARCIREDMWREYCYRGAVSAGDQHAKRMAFKRAAEGLVAVGRVGKWEPFVWLL